MKALWLLAAILPVTAAGTYVILPASEDPESPRVSAAATDPTELEIPSFLLEWKGFHKLGVADRFAHTYETEPLVAPFAKAGVKSMVPDGVENLEFEVRWTGEGSLHLMVHGPMKSDRSMPSYMTMGGAKEKLLCLRVPADQVEKGVWEVMTHPNTMGPTNVEFTILIRADGSKDAKLIEGPHGHKTMEDWEMDMRDHEKCVDKAAKA